MSRKWQRKEGEPERDGRKMLFDLFVCTFNACATNDLIKWSNLMISSTNYNLIKYIYEIIVNINNQ